ncbi:hypothetical protein EJC49_23020 [Aquibium carbonis]|uniref:Uncharacterized protein n=1 Tax=Aquibium carbonis TaxID=2495581 RepID=A0A3R9Y4Z2_9HYPH|nr:hypothetical protein [Aquibium carbonis]RST83070.1 hypothetical protein EJC49_23020 [Aquibium carbonis]
MIYKASVAQRTIWQRKIGSKTGTLVDPFRLCRYRYESALEEKVLLVSAANPSIREIREQQKLSFVRDGRRVPNWVDIQTFWKNGLVQANYLKYEEGVTRALERDIELTVDQVGDRFAHEYRIVTEADLTANQIANARDVIECAKDFDREAEGLVKAVLKVLPDRVLLAEVAAATRLGTRAVRAATAMVGKGFLEIPRNVRLDGQTLLLNRVGFDRSR